MLVSCSSFFISPLKNYLITLTNKKYFLLRASQVDTEQEQKGHSMMDAILQMFTTPKVKAEVPSTSKQGIYI